MLKIFMIKNNRMIKQILILTILCSSCLSSFSQNARWVVKPYFDAIAGFNEGIAPIKKDGKWGYINLQGEIIVPCEYEVAYSFSDDVGVLATADNSLVAIADINGHITKVETKLKIDNRFAEFSEGLLLVTDGQKWGYLNKLGRLSIECKYLFALPFNEGLAGVTIDSDGSWYYIAPNGSKMIYPGFQGTKKEIYWALSFKNGKALIVYNNGLGYINNTGKELSDRVPRFSPPDDPASYKRSALQGKEGDLIINSKGCAVSFRNKKNEVENFIPAEEKFRHDNPIFINGVNAENNINWQTSKYAIASVLGKYGIVESGESPLTIYSSNSLLESVFGNPATLSYKIQNQSDHDIDNLKLIVNGAAITEKISIPQKQQKDLTIQIDKKNGLEGESGTLNIIAEEDGLLLGSYDLKYKIVDKPSATILVPVRSFEVGKNDKTYSLKVFIQNSSNVEEDNVKVVVNNQVQNISLQPKSDNTLRFDIPKGEMNINISVKFPKAPSLTFSCTTVVTVKNDIIVKQNITNTKKGIGETKKGISETK